LFFILHHKDLYVQGKRHYLKAPLNRWSKEGQNFSNVDDDAQEGRVEFEEKDFRPTSPGHSPGVGHSINN